MRAYRPRHKAAATRATTACTGLLAVVGLAVTLLGVPGAMAQTAPPAALTAGQAYPERDVRLRAAPERTARTVSSVPRNYPVRVGLCERGWCAVEYVGVRGYVRSEHLRFADVPAPRRFAPAPQSAQDAPPTDDPAPPTGDPAPPTPTTRAAASEVDTDTVRRVGYLLADNVYRAPDAFADEVTTLDRTSRVRIAPLAGLAGWYEVYLVGAEEVLGYAYTPYLSPGAGAETARPQPER